MQKKLQGLRTRQNIIDKSLQLFSVKGFFNTSVNDILNETKLTKGGLYAHFKSKEDIWYAAYERAVEIWKRIIFQDMRKIDNPFERLKVLIDRHLRDYIGNNTFKGGGFFLNMLIEFSGQSHSKTVHILEGFERYSTLIESWIEEAKMAGIVKENINSGEAGSFIVASFYGTTAMYTASKDHLILQKTISQLHFFIDSLRS
jgi:AcrR family transcriptional regulator